VLFACTVAVDRSSTDRLDETGTFDISQSDRNAEGALGRDAGVGIVAQACGPRQILPLRPYTKPTITPQSNQRLDKTGDKVRVRSQALTYPKMESRMWSGVENVVTLTICRTPSVLPNVTEPVRTSASKGPWSSGTLEVAPFGHKSASRARRLR
jgi:hypothetical protein